MKARHLPLLLPLVVLVVFVTATVRAWKDESGWVTVGSVADLQREGVLYNEDHGLFVVRAKGGPRALSEKSPHLGDRIIFCRPSGLFEATGHGEKFDDDGDYYGGPSPSDMNRLPLKVDGGILMAKPLEIVPGPARTPRSREEPVGPFCGESLGDARGFVDG